MIFEKTSLGNITIDGRKYNHDVYLFIDGTLQERDKSHSPRIEGHRSLSEWEIEQVLNGDPDILIIGMGQSGVLPMTDSAINIIDSIKKEKNVQVIQGKTPEILNITNEALKSGKKVAGVFHTTC